MDRRKVVCSGIAVLDRNYDLAALPFRPGKVIARGYREVGGGMAATAAVAISRLGGEVVWCGRLGRDAVGETLLAMLRRHGVDTRGATVTEGARSPTSGILVDAEGERILAVFSGERLPEDAPLDPAWLNGAGAVLGDPRWITGAERLFAAAAARGIPRVLDAEISPEGVLARLVPQADHVVFSEHGLASFAGTAEPEAGLARVAPGLGAVAAVTLGARGSLWWLGGRIVAVPAPGIAARDTTGCGDVFHGAFALRLAEGADVLDAARFATATAALKAMNGEGWDGMPDRAAVAAMLARMP
ncbi:PfkB family carbohydrate kinase [Falsiroseomonas sp. HW251]|uniref:PfkB family carbohydrate kinase n=1 Tax=Falsiroseomonas sp. HW251 TaxID=3390998 RepID=UPI003D3107E1